jgi:LysM repeat protein
MSSSAKLIELSRASGAVTEDPGGKTMFESAGSTSAVTQPPHRSGDSDTSSAPQKDTSPAQAWTDALKQAKTNSPQQSVTVKPGDTMAGIAKRHNDSLAGVEQANPGISNPNLLHLGQTVYLPKTVPNQIVSGVDNSQIQPIIAAMANANAADQGSGVKNAGVHQEDMAQSAQAWDTVGQTTLNMLLNNNSGKYPEQAAAAEVKQLNALEPGNAKFAAANNYALSEATQQWTQMGVTKPQLGPIIDAYNNLQQTTNAANQYLQNPKTPHNREIAESFNSSEQQAQTKLNTAIEKSLTDAANQVGSDPKARSEAMTERAFNIQIAGPQDQAFQTAVDNANYDLQVNKPAQAVADAYANGGAAAAADKLKAITQNAGNSYYAGQIIQQSQGTIDSVTRDMGSLATSAQPPHMGSKFGNPAGETSPSETEFNQIYADLSQSVAAANTISPSGSLSADGKAAADLVANSIASNAPKNLTTYQQGLYYSGATNAITNGDGAGLTFATAAALKQRGNTDLASLLASGGTAGIQGLQSRTDSDVSAFASTTNTLHKLEATYGPLMSPGQLAKASNAYLADHPDVAKSANSELNTISQDGDAIAEAESAWNSYGGQLNGIDGQNDASAAAKSLTGDHSAGFAVSRSAVLHNAVAAALSTPSASGGGGAGSVVQAMLASPAWSIPKSTRSFINAWFKHQDAQTKALSATPSTAKGTFTALSAVGLGLSVESVIAKHFNLPFSSVQDKANTFYTLLGFGKYGGETISGLAKQGKLGDSKFATNYLAKELTKTPWFKTLGSAYYGFGALGSALQAYTDASNGDPTAAGIDSLEAFGNFLNAAKPLVGQLAKQFPALANFIPGATTEAAATEAAAAAGASVTDLVAEGAAEAIGAWGSGFGLLALGGDLIYEGIKSGLDARAYENDSTQFLQQSGLGLNPDMVDELSLPGLSGPASGALQTYAGANHISAAQLLQKLNHEPADKAIEFIDEAAFMPKQSNGQYAVSLSSDDPKQVGTHMVTEPGDKGHNYNLNVDYQADSLRQLSYWADYLFGKNGLG